VARVATSYIFGYLAFPISDTQIIYFKRLVYGYKVVFRSVMLVYLSAAWCQMYTESYLPVKLFVLAPLSPLYLLQNI